MGNIQIFKKDQFGEVRTIFQNNEPWFCLTDICKILELTQPSRVMERLKKDGVTSSKVTDSLGREQTANFVNESNLYKVIFQSRKAEAEKFTDWVTGEILPSIRKTGGYVNNEELFINTYLQFADEQTKAMFKTTLEIVRKQNEIIALKEQEIEHKDEVIVGLVDEISLAEKRQILNRVVRYKGAKFQERWRELYRQFSMKYHIELDVKLENYNKTHKPKLKNKVDYIDKVMNKIPELYEIACKLYESDVKELARSLYSLNEEVS